MQFCSACQKTPATIVILDLSDGAVSGQQHLCGPCAEGLGVVQPKAQLKMSAEILEDLLGSMQGKSAAGTRGRRDAACPGCGMTPQDFKQKGRLGCPRCYESFRAELVPLLQRVHEASSHRGRLPGRAPPAPPPTAAPTPATDALSELRRRLEEAIRGERYEEAARLRDDLRAAEKGDGGAAP